MSDRIELFGGNLGQVFRVEDTVRRQMGPWSAAIHELLIHLENVGFPYAPRFRGVDDDGREILTYLEGETIGLVRPWPAWAWTDDTLVQVAQIARAYHEAVQSFRPTTPRIWRFVEDGVDDNEVVCHNDIAPYNIVYREGRVVGLIDWDLASPSPALSDVAFVAWSFGPITTPAHAREMGASRDPLARIRLLADTYGVHDRQALLDQVRVRMLASIGGIESKAAQGELPFIRLINDGHLDRMKADADFYELHRRAWARELSA